MRRENGVAEAFLPGRKYAIMNDAANARRRR